MCAHFNAIQKSTCEVKYVTRYKILQYFLDKTKPL